jgi:hypothetical protein
MTEDVEAVDFWGVLEEAARVVASWPEWMGRYEADVFGRAFRTSDEQVFDT